MPRGGRARGGRNQRIQEVPLRAGLINMEHFATLSEPKAVRDDERRYKSKMIDALEFFGAYRGIRDKHSRMTFDTLRNMAKTCEPMMAIIRLRCNQAASFAKIPKFESDTGFRITTRDPETPVKGADRKEIRRLEEFFLRTGFERNPKRKDNLDRFLRKLVQDSLVLDAYTFEIVPGKNEVKNPVSEIYAVDAATIRFAEEDHYIPSIERDMAGEIAYVQELDGRITAEYSLDELAYGIRNPQTDVQSLGYGVSELETAINAITSILFAQQYNRAYFSNNSTPRGIINLVGNYDPEHLEYFKRAWRAQLEGASNAWRTPIMAMEDGQGINFIPLDQKGNRDMEYHLWLDYLVNNLCALYQVNPEELGLSSYNGSGKASMSEADPESKIEKGEDKGLAPLMVNVANTLTTEVLEKLNEDFVFEFAGLGAEDKQARQQYFMNWLDKGVMVVNEVRDELDMPKIDQPWANDVPANSVLYQAWAMDKQQEMAAQQPGAATAGGPQMPPNGNVNQPGDPNQKEGEDGPPQPQYGPPGQPPNPMAGGKPPMPGMGGPPKPPQPGGGKPFGKSLADEIVIEIEP